MTPTGRATSRVEAKNATKHPAVHGTASHTKVTGTKISIELRLRNCSRNSEENHCGEERLGKFHQRAVFFHELLTSGERQHKQGYGEGNQHCLFGEQREIQCSWSGGLTCRTESSIATILWRTSNAGVKTSYFIY